MAKEIQIVRWCDGPHDENDHRKADVTRRLSIDGAKARELDLCEDCDETLIAPLASLLQSAGQPLTKSGGLATPMTCPICNKTYKSDNTLRAHMRQKHDARPDGKPVAAASLPCPYCDSHFMRQQGVAMHIRAAHPEHYTGTRPMQRQAAS